MLQGIHDQFGHDQAEADRLSGHQFSIVGKHLEHPRPVTAIHFI
jgi:hypothetical protein